MSEETQGTEKAETQPVEETSTVETVAQESETTEKVEREDSTPTREVSEYSHGGVDRERSEPEHDESDPATEGRGGERSKRRGRRRVSYLTLNKIESVDYKDVGLLKRFINDHGKIIPARHTGNTAKQQRMIARAIKRAREMALLPFVQISDDERSRRI